MLPYIARKHRSLNKVEVCLSPKTHSEESCPDVVGSFSLLLGTQITILLPLSSLGPPSIGSRKNQEQRKMEEQSGYFSS